MTPNKLQDYLIKLAEDRIKLSVMIWGPPGVGKSSIVQQVADSQSFKFIDLRLSQLAPTDLRGLPVVGDGISKWLPPEFLPTEGEGILFLDEINMAPPTMQGVAQQLILDRRVGSYEVPEGWLIWAAGNRKEDKASVFDMPSPLANRFIHLAVESDFDSFKQYAFNAGLHEQILAFLSYRPKLLHSMDAKSPAWPSPRSWMMADQLHRVELSITSAVGEGAASEFEAYLALYTKMPDLSGILSAKKKPKFPKEASKRYAIVVGLASRASSAVQAMNAMLWLVDKAPAEWVQLFVADLFVLFRLRGKMAELSKILLKEEKVKSFLQDYRELIGLG